MGIFVVTFAVILFVVLAMAIGVIAGRKPIGGSCGGMGAVGLECEAGCAKPCPKRRARMKAQAEGKEE